MVDSTPSAYGDYVAPHPAAAGVPAAPPAPVASAAPVTKETERVVQISEARPAVHVMEAESCCNVYWVLFGVGFLLPILFICGAIGVRSEKRSENLAGTANAIALVAYMILTIVAAVAR